MGWWGGAKVLCILCHQGVQLILAYNWARPAILVAGKGRGGMFLFLMSLHFYSCSSFFLFPLFHLFYYLFYLFSPFLWETTQNDPQSWRVVKPQHSQNHLLSCGRLNWVHLRLSGNKSRPLVLGFRQGRGYALTQIFVYISVYSVKYISKIKVRFWHFFNFSFLWALCLIAEEASIWLCPHYNSFSFNWINLKLGDKMDIDERQVKKLLDWIISFRVTLSWVQKNTSVDFVISIIHSVLIEYSRDGHEWNCGWVRYLAG